MVGWYSTRKKSWATGIERRVQLLHPFFGSPTRIKGPARHRILCATGTGTTRTRYHIEPRAKRCHPHGARASRIDHYWRARHRKDHACCPDVAGALGEQAIGSADRSSLQALRGRHGPRSKYHSQIIRNPPPLGFQRNESLPLDSDGLVVDEVSMLDLFLTHDLLMAVHSIPCFRLVLVGDGSLPSVGAGNVLKDLMASGVVPCTRLERVYDRTQILICMLLRKFTKAECLSLESGPGTPIILCCTVPDRMPRKVLH